VGTSPAPASVFCAALEFDRVIQDAAIGKEAGMLELLLLRFIRARVDASERMDYLSP
jgi:hypothetical protein